MKTRILLFSFTFLALSACRSTKVERQAATDTTETTQSVVSGSSVASDSSAVVVSQSLNQQVDEQIVSVAETYDTAGRVVQRTTTTISRGSKVQASSESEAVSVSKQTDTIADVSFSDTHAATITLEKEKPLTARNTFSLAILLTLSLSILVALCRIFGKR